MEMAWATRVDLENHVPLFEQRGLDSLLLNGLRSAKPCLSQKPYHRTGCFPTLLAEQTGEVLAYCVQELQTRGLES